MKIVKRDKNVSAFSSVPGWSIPLSLYLFLKASGIVTFNKYEFMWWILIPAMFIIWLCINFKIIRGKK